MIDLVYKTKVKVDADCVHFQAYRHAIKEVFFALQVPMEVINYTENAMHSFQHDFSVDGCYSNHYMTPILSHLMIDVKSFCYYRALSEHYKISAIREFRKETNCGLLYAKQAIEAIVSLSFNIKNHDSYCDNICVSVTS